jgi:uncharacterized membrane protein YqaE (UPF0057 family)
MKNFSIKALLLVTLFICSIYEAEAISIPKNILSSTTTPTKDTANVSDSTISNAINEFKNLSNKEKKIKTKEVKNLLKDYKKKKKAGDDVSTNEILLAILCVILPPLAVYLHQGKETTNKFWISLILTLLFWVPGVIYALLVVFADL